MTLDAPAIDAPRPFLSLAGVSKRFGGTMALEAIDWSVDTGEVHCLVGENGSGKSTLIKIVSGVHIPDRGGSITIEGSRYPRLTPKLANRSTASSAHRSCRRRDAPCAMPRPPRSRA